MQNKCDSVASTQMLPAIQKKEKRQYNNKLESKTKQNYIFV